jgi:hypothetical protein
MSAIRGALCVVAFVAQGLLAWTSAAATIASPTCPPPPAAPTCAIGTDYVCRDECRVDCYCATETPTPTPSAPLTPTCMNTPVCNPPYTHAWCGSSAGLDRCECICEGVQTPTAPATPASCVGDCNGDNAVQINELILGITVLLGDASVSACPAIDCGEPLGLVINCAIVAVGNALNGCSLPTPTPFPTKTTDCTGVPDSEHKPCVHSCGNGICEQGFCIGECTPSPTPTPLAFGIRYRLTEGSTILSSTGPDGQVLEEPLSGTFVAESLPRWKCVYPNSVLCFAVTAVQFQSAHFTVNGSAGFIIQSTFNPDAVTISLTTLINDQPFQLGGFGPFDASAANPPPFRALELCGAPPEVGGDCAGIRAGTVVGYDVMIFANPASGN